MTKTRTKTPAPFGEIRVTLPNFIIIALRQMVKNENAINNDPRWTVSQLLESFLFQAITREEMDALGKKSPDFKREAEAWLLWIINRRPERRYRK
jgi:hypothetical protein